MQITVILNHFSVAFYYETAVFLLRVTATIVPMSIFLRAPSVDIQHQV